MAHIIGPLLVNKLLKRYENLNSQMNAMKPSMLIPLKPTG
jgi:hypothetical protein